jgi:hypothetical protein
MSNRDKNKLILIVGGSLWALAIIALLWMHQMRVRDCRNWETTAITDVPQGCLDQWGGKL